MNESLLVFSLLGPFLLWPVEYLLPYPFIIEEIFKLFLVFFFVQKTVKPFIIAGITFALTETIFYVFNANAFGSLSVVFARLILTGALHSLTFSVIYFANKIDKKLIIFGFLTTILIHYLYNRYIPLY